MSTAGTSLKDMWDTRPPRIPGRDDDGKLAGVCQGIAVRYQVNASFIRIAFLVLFFIGCIGLLLYALCVLLMPKKGRHSAPIDVIAKPKHPLTPEDEQDRILGWAMILLLACFSSSTIFKFGEAYGLTVPPGRTDLLLRLEALARALSRTATGATRAPASGSRSPPRCSIWPRCARVLRCARQPRCSRLSPGG